MGNPKEKVEGFEKLGISEITFNDWNEKFNGYSSRSTERRFSEHLANIRSRGSDKSAMPHKVLISEDYVNESSLKFVRHVTKRKLLDA